MRAHQCHLGGKGAVEETSKNRVGEAPQLGEVRSNPRAQRQ